MLFDKLFTKKDPEHQEYESTKQLVEMLIQQKDTVNNELTKISQELKDKKDELAAINRELDIKNGFMELEELGLPYEPTPETLTDVQQMIVGIKSEMAKMAHDKSIAIKMTGYKLNGSEAKGRKLQEFYCDSIITGFNTFFGKKLKSVTNANFNQTIQSLGAKFDRLDKKMEMMGSNLNLAYLNLCIDLLEYTLKEKNAKIEERERLKAEREILREQDRLLEEAEKERAKLQKERRMYEQSLAKSLTDEERQQFEDKLREIDKREQDIDYRVNNSRAGYLYIASTPAMPGIIKAGATRRLNPLIRIQELSSASTPFPFVCHGLVFSDDVFTLETQVHNYFDVKRTNKENKHKEFFNITPNEAIQVLENEFNCQVHFVSVDEQEDEE